MQVRYAASPVLLGPRFKPGVTGAVAANEENYKKSMDEQGEGPNQHFGPRSSFGPAKPHKIYLNRIAFERVELSGRANVDDAAGFCTFA